MIFAIHWHEAAMDLHVFPIPIPSPASFSIPSLWVFPVHQPWALVSCFQPGWWSVSPLIVYLFQCCFFRTSHPRLLPQSPKVCSVHLGLFFCFSARTLDKTSWWLATEFAGANPHLPYDSASSPVSRCNDDSSTEQRLLWERIQSEASQKNKYHILSNIIY